MIYSFRKTGSRRAAGLGKDTYKASWNSAPFPVPQDPFAPLGRLGLVWGEGVRTTQLPGDWRYTRGSI